MFDVEKIKEGHFARGLIYLQRQDPTSAKKAFIEASDFPNARRQLPFILKDLGAPPAEIIAALISALDSGDLQALPWLVKFDKEFKYGHPDIKLLKKDLDKAVKEENQSVLLGLMRIAREEEDVKEYINLIVKLTALGNPNARCELVNLIMQAPAFPKEYALLRKQQGKLPVISGLKPAFKEIPEQKDDFAAWESEEQTPNFLNEEDYFYLSALLDQGDDAKSSGANTLKYFLDMTVRRYQTFEEYIQELIDAADSRWEDPHYLLVFATELRTYAPNHDLRLFRKSLEPYELSDFLDELLEEIQAPIPETLFEDEGANTIERTAANISPEKAFAYFEKYETPLFSEFLASFKMSPVAANKKYVEFMSQAMAGKADYFGPTASALEFIDRGYYDFDLVDPMLHGLVMRKLPSLIESTNNFSSDFLEYLYTFEGGEAYFLDDIRRRVANHPNTPAAVKEHFNSLDQLG